MTSIQNPALEKDFYDVLIVGAGPAGATCAFYFMQGQGNTANKLSLALLDKAQFPRDKYCGDAWCAPALDLLEEMGVLQELESEGLTQNCSSGGFVSPSGESYMATENGEAQVSSENRTYAIKRKICDERIARKAASVGAELIESANVSNVYLDADEIWTVTCEDGRRFRCKMLVAADGASSKIARQLGVVNSAPEGVASRQYVKGGTHNFKSGGVLFFPDYMLPGYVALFRHYNDDIDLGAYVIPGGAAQPEELLKIYQEKIYQDPFIQRVLGPNVEYLERVKTASLRLGGEAKSTAKQFLVLGDAAGQTDPLTGEGIHTGMIAGKIAAQVMLELFAKQSFSESACALYHERWMNEFGKDFKASAIGAKLVYKFPFLMDSASTRAQKVGDEFMNLFGSIMTGVLPKATFLKPSIAAPMTAELVKVLWKQKVLGQPSGRAAYDMKAVEYNQRASSFSQACLINPDIDVEDVKQKWQQKQKNSGAREVFRYASENDGSSVKNVLILYGTEYGFSKESAFKVAQSIAELDLANLKLSPRCLDMQAHECINWQQTHVCIFICATAGDGIPPVHAQGFFKFLSAQKNVDLSHLRFSLLAPGNSSYPAYCRAGHFLNELLLGHSAQPFLDIFELDQEDEMQLEKWLKLLAQKMHENSLWEKVPAYHEDYLSSKVEDYFSRHEAEMDSYSKNNPFYAKVIEKRDLCKVLDADDRETVHIELDLSAAEKKFSWSPGDSIGVLPENCPEKVSQVLSVLGMNESTLIIDVQSNQTILSLKELLLKRWDISLVTKNLLDFLLAHASTEEQQKWQDFANQVSGDAYRVYINQYELVDAMKFFPSALKAMHSENIAALFKTLQPRYYSISSSMLADAKRLSITVAAVRYQTPSGLKKGLASNYLVERIVEGDTVAIFVQKNPEFRLPDAFDKACIMIGPGTGVAPFRAFLQELKAQDRLAKAQHVLYFGSRYQQRDFLYAEEWMTLAAKQELHLFSAFSRDQQHKIYVQDRLLEQKQNIWRSMEEGAYFYICGDATQMARDVEARLLSIIQEQGAMQENDAQQYLKMLADAGRYNKDVWA